MPQQTDLFPSLPDPSRDLLAPKTCIVPSYVWESAREEWESIYRQLQRRGVRRQYLEEATNREFCRRDPCVKAGGIFPRSGGVDGR